MVDASLKAGVPYEELHLHDAELIDVADDILYGGITYLLM